MILNNYTVIIIIVLCVTGVHISIGQNPGPLYPFPMQDLGSCPGLYAYIAGLFKVNMWDLSEEKSGLLVKHTTISLENSDIGLGIDPVLFTIWQYLSHVGCLSALSRRGLHIPYKSSIKKYCINHLEDPIYRYNPLVRDNTQNFKKEKALIPIITYNIIHPKSEIKPSLAVISLVDPMPCYNSSFPATWSINIDRAYEAISKEIPDIPLNKSISYDSKVTSTTSKSDHPQFSTPTENLPAKHTTINPPTTLHPKPPTLTTSHTTRIPHPDHEHDPHSTYASTSTPTLLTTPNTHTTTDQEETHDEAHSVTHATQGPHKNQTDTSQNITTPMTTEKIDGDTPSLSSTPPYAHSLITFEAPLTTFLTTGFL